MVFFRDKWVPFAKACRVLRFRMKERPSMWKVSPNRSNKQPRSADKGRYFSWWLGEVLTSPYRKTYLVTKPRNWTQALANALMNLWVP